MRSSVVLVLQKTGVYGIIKVGPATVTTVTAVTTTIAIDISVRDPTSQSVNLSLSGSRALALVGLRDWGSPSGGDRSVRLHRGEEDEEEVDRQQPK